MSLSGPASPRAQEPKRMILSGENRSAIRRTRSSRTVWLSATALMVFMITRTAAINTRWRRWPGIREFNPHISPAFCGGARQGRNDRPGGLSHWLVARAHRDQGLAGE